MTKTYKWTPAEITIATATAMDKGKRKKQKIIAEICSGLAVHEEASFRMRLSAGFVVTHVRSGLKVTGDFVSRGAAKRYAQQLFPLADWNGTVTSITKGVAGKKRKAAVEEIRKKYRGFL